jgi:hypothetical protein
MSELEKILIEASLLSTAGDAESNAEVQGSSPGESNLSIISRMKMTIHENLVQESGKSFGNPCKPIRPR